MFKNLECINARYSSTFAVIPNVIKSLQKKKHRIINNPSKNIQSLSKKSSFPSTPEDAKKCKTFVFQRPLRPHMDQPAILQFGGWFLFETAGEKVGRRVAEGLWHHHPPVFLTDSHGMDGHGYIYRPSR